MQRDPSHPQQHLDPARTTWHITFGTYGARLHGGSRPTVDKTHNRRGEPFIREQPQREASERQAMRGEEMRLTAEQRRFIQAALPAICERGGWVLRACAAGPDHVHVLADLDPAVHGEKVRRLIKRWLGQTLTERFGRPDADTWWAEEGSNRAIHDTAYLNNAYAYVVGQRA